MGYRSDVYLKTTKEGYKALKEEIRKNSRTGYALFTTPENIVYNKLEGSISMEWNCIKWYLEYDAIKAIDDAIYAINDKYPLHFIRIGEDLEDIEDRYYEPDTPDGKYIEPLDLERTVYLHGDKIDEEDI